MNDDEFLYFDPTMRAIGKWIGYLIGFIALCFVAGFVYGRWVL